MMAFALTTITDVKRLQRALNEARLSLMAIGHPAPLDPPDSRVCGHIARGALIRIDAALTE